MSRKSYRATVTYTNSHDQVETRTIHARTKPAAIKRTENAIGRVVGTDTVTHGVQIAVENRVSKAASLLGVYTSATVGDPRMDTFPVNGGNVTIVVTASLDD